MKAPQLQKISLDFNLCNNSNNNNNTGARAGGGEGGDQCTCVNNDIKIRHKT